LTWINRGRSLRRRILALIREARRGAIQGQRGRRVPRQHRRSLGKRLGPRVIAEGVETPAQRPHLEAHGCEEIQGYLVGKPMPAAQFEALLGKVEALA